MDKKKSGFVDKQTYKEIIERKAGTQLDRMTDISLRGEELVRPQFATMARQTDNAHAKATSD